MSRFFNPLKDLVGVCKGSLFNSVQSFRGLIIDHKFYWYVNAVLVFRLLTVNSRTVAPIKCSMACKGHK